MSTPTPGEPTRAVSATETLADMLSLALDDFADAFGAGWQLLPTQGHNFDADPSGMGNIFGDWYVAGEPFQITLRPRDSGVELGIPVGQWVGAHGIFWESKDRRTVHGTGPQVLDAAPLVIAEILKRRRAKFRYCRYCRRLTPPEERLSADVCYGCGTEWRGIIY